jgi:pyruvate dehydrogenase E2 component (dihydrolipoamide acetyltransferase)
LPHASPSIRKLARELGVPLDEVKGSGPKGRIVQEDVQGFVKNVMSGALQTKAQATKAPPRRRPRRHSGAAALANGGLHEVRSGGAQGPLAHQEDQRREPAPQLGDDPARHEQRRRRHHRARGVPRSTNKENEKSGASRSRCSAFVIKAVVSALKKFPDFNASLDGDQLVYKQYFHVGFAADTPNGLVVPVLKDADKKGILQISTEMGELAKKARDGKLGPAT